MAIKKAKKFVCYISGVNWDVYNFDEFRCGLGNFGMFLYGSGFGYICLGLIVIVILISIFGGIKDNYRWFILNQVIWDLIYR